MSKIKLCLVTFGIITGIIGILHGCAELLNGSLLVEQQNVAALPVNWPNQAFYSKMQGAPVFSLLTGIPYYVIGLLAISVSITFIACSLTVIDVSKSGIIIFSLLNVAIFCFGAGRGTPVIEGIPTIIAAVLSLKLTKRERSLSSKTKLLVLFNFFYWWNIVSWVLFVPVIFPLSFYQEIPTFLFLFMGLSMPIATIGALTTGFMYDKAIPINEV